MGTSRLLSSFYSTSTVMLVNYTCFPLVILSHPLSSNGNSVYKVFDLKNYTLLYSIPDRNVQEIKIRYFLFFGLTFCFAIPFKVLNCGPRLQLRPQRQGSWFFVTTIVAASAVIFRNIKDRGITATTLLNLGVSAEIPF